MVGIAISKKISLEKITGLPWGSMVSGQGSLKNLKIR
jgi:hypothetical protein